MVLRRWSLIIHVLSFCEISRILALPPQPPQHPSATTLPAAVATDDPKTTGAFQGAVGESLSTSFEGVQTKTGNGTGQTSSPRCVLRCIDPTIHGQIRRLVDEEMVKLIEYSLLFPSYNSSPLISNTTIFKAESWARVSSRHGQTLLSLSFNYGILSMMTLSVGTASLDVPLEDDPSNCIERLGESEQYDRVLDLMLRDFQDVPDATITGKERLCHEAIVDDDGYAKFVDICCYVDEHTKEVVCEQDVVNIWLQLLQLSCFLIRLAVLFFGPLLFMSTVISISRKNFPYVVKLKEPLVKKVVVSGDGVQLDPNVKAAHYLNLRSEEGYPKLMKSLENCPLGQPIDIQIQQYDILVSYKRTLTENSVPVGFWRSIFGVLFRCKLRNVGPFKDCCKVDMFRLLGGRWKVPWIAFWSKVGLVLMAVLLPTPFYLRLYVFYEFEYEEVLARKEAIARLGLDEQFTSNPLHYFTPTHPAFLVIYVVYFVTAAVIGLTVRHGKEGAILRIVTGAFDDLQSLPWTTVLHVMTENVIWPFKRFGLVGCLVAVFYWPLALPLTVVLYAFYCLPSVYLTVRMIFYSRRNFLLRTARSRKIRPYRARKRPDSSIKLFEVERLFGCGRRRQDVEFQYDETPDDLGPTDLDVLPSAPKRLLSETTSVASTVARSGGSKFRRCFVHLASASLCVVALYSVLIVASECIGSLVEVGLFTLMGIIVNAAVLLKYVALVILLVVYSYDCFNDVQKNYLKLNKALFSEVKGRIKGIDDVTSQPSYLQENHGFKSQELSEQAFYEAPDDVEPRQPGFWLINDLVLFIDNEDMPRIPLKLFEEVCQIRVAGVPGPVYRGHLLALSRFSKIVLFVFFVFVVVLSFSEAYHVSSTNQMLATLAGGFLPLILRTLMGAGAGADLELNTLSFRSKLDEVIKNYSQFWPIYDLPFKLVLPEENGENDVEGKENNNMKLEMAAIEWLSQINNEGSGTKAAEEIAALRRNGAERDGTVVTFMEETKIEEKVDIVIEVPGRIDKGQWLDQWSDLE